MRSQGVRMRLLAYTIAVMAICLIAAFATWGDPWPGGEMQAKSPMALVASAGGIERRVGVVHSRSQRSFASPGKISPIGAYPLMADPAGTHDPISLGPFTVTAGPSE